MEKPPPAFSPDNSPEARRARMRVITGLGEIAAPQIVTNDHTYTLGENGQVIEVDFTPEPPSAA